MRILVAISGARIEQVLAPVLARVGRSRDDEWLLLHVTDTRPLEQVAGFGRGLLGRGARGIAPCGACGKSRAGGRARSSMRRCPGWRRKDWLVGAWHGSGTRSARSSPRRRASRPTSSRSALVSAATPVPGATRSVHSRGLWSTTRCATCSCSARWISRCPIGYRRRHPGATGDPTRAGLGAGSG